MVACLMWWYCLTRPQQNRAHHPGRPAKCVVAYTRGAVRSFVLTVTSGFQRLPCCRVPGRGTWLRTCLPCRSLWWRFPIGWQHQLTVVATWGTYRTRQQGTHAELLAKGGLYATLYAEQFSEEPSG